MRLPAGLGRARVRLAAVLALGALLAAACGGGGSSTTSGSPLAVAGIERAIAASILKERHITTAVRCPSDVPRQKGYSFTCHAKLDVGSYPVTVTEQNTAGGVTYANSAPLRVLSIASIERAIRRAILRQRHLRATVTCPKLVLQKKGVNFSCSARTRKGVGSFKVTQINDFGGVRFRGV